MDQGRRDEDVRHEAELVDQGVNPLPPLQIPAGFDGDRESEGIGAGGRGGREDEAAEAREGVV